MKFNFEKAKDVIKKTTVGAGIVTASFSPLKSNAQEIKQDQDTIKNKTAISMDPEYYRNEYIKYMEHPSYKARLAKEMFENQIIDEDKQRKVDKEYNERLSQLKSIKIYIDESKNTIGDNNSEYNRKGDYISTNINDIDHEFSHSLDYRKSKDNPNEGEEGFAYEKLKLIFEHDDDSSSTILSDIDRLELEKYKEKEANREYTENYNKFIDILNKYIDNNKDNPDFKENHPDLISLINEINSKQKNITTWRFFDLFSNPSEQLFLIKNNIELLQKIQKYEKKFNDYDRKIDKLQKYFDYLNSNTEIRARLNYLRIKAVKEYGFNLNDIFDINNFEELKKDMQYLQLKKELGFTDDEINELMKYTAMNEENNNSDTYYHPDWNYDNKEGQA